jgi:hypothetical protein
LNDEEDAYIWFDLFSANQHVSNEAGTKYWADGFQNAVKEIGRVVVVLSPWEDPIPFQRAWCLWEIYCAIETESKLDVAMDNTERKSFVKGLVEDPSVYYKTLAKIDVEKSKATKQEDADVIHSTVRRLEGGFKKVNQVVCGHFQKHMRTVVREAIESIEEMEESVREEMTQQVDFNERRNRSGSDIIRQFNNHNTPEGRKEYIGLKEGNKKYDIMM